MADPTEAAPDPGESTLTTEQTAAKLSTLRAYATKEYSLKNYTQAADFYSEATELQAEINGEMSPQNAELLYAYGRCLYHVAISKSDVLGSKVAGSGNEEPKKKKRKVDKGESSDALISGEERMAEEVVEAVVEEKDATSNGAKDGGANKPFFQIEGDENWTDSEGEEEEGAEEEQDDEEDDFANAYEVLDLARVLLSRQLEAVEEAEQDSAGKGKAPASGSISPDRRAVMERLADTHDLQAEIWLESERFSDAIPDFQSALELKLKLYPPENSMVAEAHYKLSLALEFASIRKSDEGEAVEPGKEKPADVDEEMRQQAASHMEKAIASCKSRVEREKGLLAAVTGDEKAKKERNIKEVEEMLQDLNQRLTDLKGPVVTLNGGPAGAPSADALGGILGSILGESTAEQKARIAEATKGANDLTGLVKKKAPKPATAAATTESTKRKLDDGEAENGVNGKKAKVVSE
ncbi:NASP-related protein sim3 [Sphaceloma murrayae]|uniref:NASP-related protein sim3 n=1 Tax=Sphaceloma murrayae TaxID=2082308 RepID=A0A2K1QMD3_9PEZI|nr:NASP-related protein sim3 [Sphaceloma murrayae]